jgi:hypothetical protein
VFHGGTSILEFASSPGVGGTEPSLCHLQEATGAGVERLGGECLEALGEPAVHQRRPLLRGAGTLVGGPGPAGQFGRGVRLVASRVQQADHGAQDKAEREHCQQQDRVHVCHSRSPG